MPATVMSPRGSAGHERGKQIRGGLRRRHRLGLLIAALASALVATAPFQAPVARADLLDTTTAALIGGASFAPGLYPTGAGVLGPADSPGIQTSIVYDVFLYGSANVGTNVVPLLGMPCTFTGASSAPEDLLTGSGALTGSCGSGDLSLQNCHLNYVHEGTLTLHLQGSCGTLIVPGAASSTLLELDGALTLTPCINDCPFPCPTTPQNTVPVTCTREAGALEITSG